MLRRALIGLGCHTCPSPELPSAWASPGIPPMRLRWPEHNAYCLMFRSTSMGSRCWVWTEHVRLNTRTGGK